MEIFFILFLVCVLFFIVLSVVDVFTFDVKDKGIPSALTTGFVIIMFFSGNVGSGLLACLFSLLFFELGVWEGLADMKVFVASSMLFGLSGVLLYVVLVVCFGLVGKFIVRSFFKKAKSMPFIPVIMFCFLVNVFCLHFYF